MKMSKFSESQIITALKEHELGSSVEEISRELGINKGTYSSWCKLYGGLEISHMKLLKELQVESSE